MKQGDLINQKYVLKKLRKSNQCNQTWHAEQAKTTLILKFIKFPIRSEKQLAKQRIILQKSKHENMVNILESFTCDRESSRYLVIVMQQCPDGDFARLIQNINKKSERWELPQKLEFMLQMTKGIRYLHENEVAHRNIKPENIFRIEGRVKIGDLDLAGIYKIKSTQQLSGGSGFPLYKAPEAHQSNAYYLESDIWSLGLVFLQLILELRLKDLERWQKEPCFEKKEIQGLTKKIKDMNKGVYDIIMGMLETDRQRRGKAEWVVGALNKSIQELKKGKEKPVNINHSKLSDGDITNNIMYMPCIEGLIEGTTKFGRPMQLSSSQIPSFVAHKLQEGNELLLKKSFKPKTMAEYEQKGSDLQYIQQFIPNDYNQEVEIQQIKEPKRQYKKEGSTLYAKSPDKKTPIYQAGYEQAEFILKLMAAKDYFEQMTDEEIKDYLPKKQKKIKEKSEWFDIPTRNNQQRIKIRYNGFNDSLVIHYGMFEQILGIQHLPIEIRFNWPTVEDLFLQLKKLRPEEVDVTEKKIIRFRAKKSPDYEKRLKQYKEQQQQLSAQTQEPQSVPHNSHKHQPVTSKRVEMKFSGHNNNLSKYDKAYFDSRFVEIHNIDPHLQMLQKSTPKSALTSLYCKFLSNYKQIIQGLFQLHRYQECLQVMKQLLSRNITAFPNYNQVKNQLQVMINGMIHQPPNKVFLKQIQAMLVNYMKESNLLPFVNSELIKLKGFGMML